MPDDLDVMRTTVMELESSVVPPDFAELQARAQARRGGRRIARAALVLTLIVAVGLVWRWAGPGPLAAQPAIPQVTQSHDPDLSLAAAAARVAPVIANAGTIERIVGNDAGMVLAVYASCAKPTDCERGWRIMTHSGDTKGQDAPIDPGTVVGSDGLRRARPTAGGQ